MTQDDTGPATTDQTPTTGSGAKWREVLETVRAAFPSPWREQGEDRVFEQTFLEAVGHLNRLKHPRVFQQQKAWQGYLGDPDLPDYSQCHQARLAEGMRPLDEVIREVVGLFNGMPNWNHPQIMANVVPPANTAAVLGAALAHVFNPNILEGEYSWNIARAEIEAGAMLAELVGWDPATAGGVFTYGGGGCYLYGLKLALTHVFGKESRFTGIREDGQLLVSREAHFVKANCTDWTGLGMNNVREVPVDDENRMSIPALKEALDQCRQEGKPVVAVVCTMGTTDAFAIDPIAEVRELIDGYENAKGYPKPLIYADAVIGWSWLAFRAYDFEANPLEFSPKSLKILRHNFRQVEPLDHADAIGMDFHKTGWAPYNCSFFLVKDYARMEELLGRPLPAYLQDRTPYNPFKFTLESSRTGAYALAGWATLRLFGYEGFQVLLGRIIEVSLYFRRLLEAERSTVCVNPDNHGFVTLFRVYPRHVDAARQYERELHDPATAEQMRAYNLLQQRVANKLFAMLRDADQKVPGWENPPYTSFTSGYRPPRYAPEETDRRGWLYALKAYPMSPNANELSMLIVRNYVLKARDLAVEELLAEGRLGREAAAPTPEGAARTARDWFGDNEPIPAEYLTPSAEGPSLAESLGAVPMCSHLPADRLDRLVSSGTTETMADGEVICAEGDPADKVYFVIDGRVEVYKDDEGETELATLGPGSLFGEMALLDRSVRSACVKAIEPCRCLVIPGDRFLELVLG